MYIPVALLAERDEVLDDVISKQAPWADVMHLKIVRSSAVLTAPLISLEHLLAQLVIGIWKEPSPRPFGPRRIHDASRTSARNSAFSG